MAAPTQQGTGGSGGGGGTDERVKVSIADTTAGYLSASLTAETDTPITFNILNPGANEVLEIDLDGDQLHIDWVPTNYTRNATPVEAADIQDLVAHLKGIDDLLSNFGLVYASAADTTPSYLQSSLVAATDTPLAFGLLNPGADESVEITLDGDKVDIDWNPAFYTPDASIAEADDVDDLSAHLKGIDDQFEIVDTIDRRLHIEKMFNHAYTNHYTEFTYSGTKLTDVEIWENNTKTTPLFTRVLTYTGNNVTTIVTTDLISTDVLTTTLNYSGVNLTDTTKVVS